MARKLLGKKVFYLHGFCMGSQFLCGISNETPQWEKNTNIIVMLINCTRMEVQCMCSHLLLGIRILTFSVAFQSWCVIGAVSPCLGTITYFP